MTVDDLTRTLFGFLDARVIGRGAEGFLCCEAKDYRLVYGDPARGRISGYVVESRRAADSDGAVIFFVRFTDPYLGEPEEITVGFAGNAGSVRELKIKEISYLGD